MNTQIVATTTEDVARQFEFTVDQLREKLSGVPTEITCKEDYEAIKKHLATCRALNGEIESTRKSLNELALKHQRLVNSYAGGLKQTVADSAAGPRRLKDAEDKRRDEAKRAKEEAERRAREEEIRRQREEEEARLKAEREAEERRIAEERAKLEAEQKRLAAEKAAAEAELRRAHEEAEAVRRAEEERIAAERRAAAEAARKEQAHIDAERKRLEVEKAAQEAAQRAEQEKLEAEARAERERLEAERRELAEAKRQVALAEERRQAEERARHEREERIEAALALPQEAWGATEFKRDFLGPDESPVYCRLIGRTDSTPKGLVYLHETDMDDPRVVACRTNALAARKRREDEEAAVREQERKAELARRLEALQPDKEKAVAYIDKLLAVEVPDVNDKGIHGDLERLVAALEMFRADFAKFGEEAEAAAE